MYLYNPAKKEDRLMKKTKHFNSLIAMVLTLVMVIGLVEGFGTTRVNAQQAVTTGTQSLVVDLDTSTKYSESLGDNASTEFSGRIWTDKSVYSANTVFETFGGGKHTAMLDASKGENFLVTYSSLGTSKAVSGETQAPIDVMFVIDISGSMSNSDSGMDNGRSRIANTVSAVNTAIDKLLAMNAYTRIGVVAFSTNATILLPLDRYTKTRSRGSEVPFFSLSSGEPSNSGSVTLYTNAINARTGNTIEKSTSVSGGTNTQLGLYTGMNALATESSTTVNVGGSTIKRTPSVVLLSDGAITYTSSGNWWNGVSNSNNGNGSSPYYGNGFKMLLTGAYMKDVINDHYQVEGTSSEVTLYTIGMGISELNNYERYMFDTYYTGEQHLAYIALNPGAHLDHNNEMAKNIRKAWETYTSQAPNGNGTVSVTVSSESSYTVAHPQSPLKDVYTATDKDALKNLVNAYYDADNANAVANVFDQIVSSISLSAPQVPTELKSADFMSDGYITYVDPIGKYMEVKDVKTILYAGTAFETKTVTKSGNTTTYTFDGQIDSAVYGKQSISSIIITVTKDSNGDETVTVKIPAGAIPIRINSVTLNADGSVKTHTNNGAYPARVIYSVGIKNDVKAVADNGETYIDLTKIDETYRKANTNADGTINFYANKYSKNTVNGITVGDAYVEFEPSHTNPFYYILEPMPIYKDRACTVQVTAAEGITPTSTYYYKDVYYHGNVVEETPIARTGAQLLNLTENSIDAIDGYLYRAVGSPRLNRLMRFEGTKVINATDTASDFYLPTFVHAEGNPDPFEGRFIIYLGNNGVITKASGGNLTISKTVTTVEGITAPDKDFTFTLDINGNDVSNLVFDYTVFDADGNALSSSKISKNAPTVILKAGQYATIYSLPPATTYTVTEEAVSGFTSSSTGASGTIVAGNTSVATFVNDYAVASVTDPEAIEITKVFTGRVWESTDSFTFKITPYNNAPYPAGYNDADGVTVTGPSATDPTTNSVKLGGITFTAPGVFRYTVYEADPEVDETLPAVSYSNALYRIVYTVVDNGAGALEIADKSIQKLYTDDGAQLFTYDANNQIVMNAGQEAEDEIVFVNTYSVSSVTRVPAAFKEYTDLSGNKPLVSGMFSFELKATGYSVDDGAIIDDITNVPVPADAVNGISITSNEGRNITFPGITFSQSDIPAGASRINFYYEVREIIPAGAVNNRLNGFIYDDTVYKVKAEISIDSSSSDLIVKAMLDGGAVMPIFTNTYDPAPTSASIEGSKTLIGRDLKSGESFRFRLEGANALTLDAIAAGKVVIPNAVAALEDLKDGVKAPFAFEGISFTAAGEYVFKVTEVNDGLPSIEYDETVYYVRINVVDNNGALAVASLTYSGGVSSADFVNTYSASFDDAPVTLTGTKELTGKSLLNGEFYFSVISYFNGTQLDEIFVTHSEDIDADSNGVYVGDIIFVKDATYSAAGDYTYLISENIPANKVEGTTYDETSFRYTVKVRDVDKVGKLTVTDITLEKNEGNGWVAVTSGDTAVFNNVYEAEPDSATVPVIHKLVSGDRAENLAAGEFEFKLSVNSAFPQDGITLPAVTVAANEADGSVRFDSVTFTKPGEYSIKITEIIPDDADKVPGITYSTQEIIVNYHVTDNRIGNLIATRSSINGVSITNSYEATPGTAEFEFSKVLNGREWLTTDAFDFTITPDADTLTAIEEGLIELPNETVVNGVVTKTIDTKDEKALVSAKVNKIGTYTFTVKENASNIKGITDDTTEYTVVITATDNTLEAVIDCAVTVDGEDASTFTFTNTYSAESVTLSGEAELTVEKSFTGRQENKWLDSDVFQFVLAPADAATDAAVLDQSVVLGETTVTVNASKKTAHFGDITFNKVGEYHFKVTETKGNLAAVTYDDSVLNVYITVTDNNEGKLVATVKDTSDKLIFSNLYTVDPNGVEVQLNATKFLSGRDLVAGEFEFVLKDTDGNAIQNVKNDADGKIKFTALKYVEAGTYTYTVAEVKGSLEDVIYDESVYTVTVTVTDNNEGKLVATIEITENNTAVNGMLFENIYAKTVDTSDFTTIFTFTLLAVSVVAVFMTAFIAKRKRED